MWTRGCEGVQKSQYTADVLEGSPLSVVSTWKTLLDSNMEDSYLLDGLVDLVESDVEVELLLLEGGPLLVVQLHKVLRGKSRSDMKILGENHTT